MIESGNLFVRPLKKEDAVHLVKWLNDPEVLQWYEGRDRPHDLNKVYEHFYECDNRVIKNLVMWNQTPIGYVQYYPLSEKEKRIYGYKRDESLYGMDQFIGELSYQDRGIGTQLVNTVAAFLFNKLEAGKVVMDPQLRNPRALRCYEKCGFRPVRYLKSHEMHEGKKEDCLLIEKIRSWLKLNEWKQSLENAIEQRNWSQVIILLEKEKTKHAGSAPAATKRKVIKAILKQWKAYSDVLWAGAEFLGDSESPSAKEVSAHLIPEVYEFYPEECAQLLHKIADDANWEVREWGASGCCEILTERFEKFYPVMEVWKEDDSENIRRATVLSVMYASKSLDESYAPRLLKIIEPLMKDDSEYVKKNLGAFAIGDGLLKRYPEHVLSWLKSLVGFDDETVRCNVAMVFSAAAARSYYKEGDKLLAQLEKDERNTIQRAVKKARRNLDKAIRVT
ncbi:GNAT family N-acetyltransferase [Pseudalkalibacillus sp. R45]